VVVVATPAAAVTRLVFERISGGGSGGGVQRRPAFEGEELGGEGAERWNGGGGGGRTGAVTWGDG